LINTGDPSWTTKGNQRTLYALKWEFDLLLDRFRQRRIRRKQLGDGPRGQLRKSTMNSDCIKKIPGWDMLIDLLAQFVHGRTVRRKTDPE
jgi:hypothetical protein